MVYGFSRRMMFLHKAGRQLVCALKANASNFNSGVVFYKLYMENTDKWAGLNKGFAV